MSQEQPTPATLVDVDSLMLHTLELEGLFCFQCPLCSDPRFGYSTARECRTTARDLVDVVSGRRSGVKAVLAGGRIAGYAVFGPAEVFRNVESLGFEPDEDALLIAALYALPDARGENLDIDLLIAVMGFAREHGFEQVQAVCREEGENEPEARAEILRASGFEITEPVDGLCLATIDLADWDAPGDSE